jgi:hypothetical protein
VAIRPRDRGVMRALVLEFQAELSRSGGDDDEARHESRAHNHSVFKTQGAFRLPTEDVMPELRGDFRAM